MMKFPKLISASAGSGKTYQITNEILNRLTAKKDAVEPNEIIATTFTRRAANELKNRIRELLIEKGEVKKANLMNDALIGTVHSIGLKIIEKYAFELGLSPMLESLDENDQNVILRECLEDVLDNNFYEIAARVYQMESKPHQKDTITYIKHIEEIISAARSNNIQKEELIKFAKYSIEEYWKIFDSQSTNDSEEIKNHAIEDYQDQKDAILQLLEPELESLRPRVGSLGKGVKSDFYTLDGHMNKLKQDELRWQDWVKLNGIKLADLHFSSLVKEEIKNIVNRLPYNTKYREDWNLYISSCFEYAAKTMDLYEKHKKENGLLDFPDQEAEFYRLLSENPKLAKNISESYRLLVVDEFQDTSPLQLALFFKLTQILDVAIWVGDPKQSIYGFRGTDPALMKAVTSSMKDNKQNAFKVLGESYRSRQDLVEFSNHIFAHAFEDSPPEKAVRLKVAPNKFTNRIDKEEKKLGTALNYWNLDNDKNNINQTLQNEALAIRIEKLIKEDKPIVFDKENKKYRLAEYGDVAILARKNTRCQGLAAELSKAGVPVAASGPGLSEEPEIVFLLALLKLLVYPFDTLAKAEIQLYSEKDNVEDVNAYAGDREGLFNDRMDAMLNDKAFDWGSDNKYISKLLKDKETLSQLSVSRTIEQLMSSLHLGKLFAAWGDVNQKLANVDAFIKQAVEFEDIANRLKIASSLAGFINWFSALVSTSEDFKGEQSGNAVQVMTYHGSKGLEWPIVILYQLDTELRDRFYGVNVIPAKDVVFEDPLANRKIRFWIKPYNGTTSHELIDRLTESSSVKKASMQAALQEEARLYYVAITRARDYLYFCTCKNAMDVGVKINPSMNLSADPSFDLELSELEVEGRKMKINSETIMVPPQHDFSIYNADQQRNYFPKPLAKTKKEVYKIQPSSSDEKVSHLIGDVIDSSQKIFFKRGVKSDKQIGDFIHSAFAAFEPGRDEENQMIISDLMTSFGMEGLVDEQSLKVGLESFYNFLNTSLGEVQIYKELPIQYRKGKQYLSGYVDLLCETKDGLYIIDHKTWVNLKGEKAKYKEHTVEYAPQLSIYKEVLEKSFEKPVLGNYINYFLAGIMVPVEFEEVTV